MARPEKEIADRINCPIDEATRKALERWRKRLEKQRGSRVSRSDAARAAIVFAARSGAAP